MKKLIEINNIEVRMDDQRNGAVTTYTIRIIPSVKIYTNDIFKLDFPKELGLVAKPKCDIGDKARTTLRKISCERIGDRGVQFNILKIDDSHEAGIALELTISEVRNPYSTRPTSNFNNIFFTDDHTGSNMAEYTRDLYVATKVVDQLKPLKAGIKQSSYVPTKDAIVEIFFETNNPLPSTTAIVVDAPLTLMQVYPDLSECKIFLKDDTMADLAEITTRDCKIIKSQVIINKAFERYSD